MKARNRSEGTLHHGICYPLSKCFHSYCWCRTPHENKRHATACLKNLISFTVLTEVLNYFNKSICFDLLQICRYLFIEISYLEWVLQTSRSAVPDNDLTAYASWATKALLNPPPLLISSELCNKGSPSMHAPSPTAQWLLPKWQFARMRMLCLVFLCDTEFCVNWWKRFLFAQVRGQQKAQETPQFLCPPWGRHKDAMLAYLLHALMWPGRISCITLLLQQGGTSRKPWSFTDLTANSQHSENRPS